MKLHRTITIPVSREHHTAAEIVKAGTVSAQSHERGVTHGEPLIVMFESLLRYAKAHALKFEHKLSDDGFLAAPFLAALRGVRELLNGDGAVAHERNVSTDSKDNGVCESLFWAAMSAAGFTEADL